MSKYDVLKKDAETAAQAGTPMIGLKISTLLALIEERSKLLDALYQAHDALLNAEPQIKHDSSEKKRHDVARQITFSAIVKAEAE